MERLEFPKGFLWGAATSSHQIEGGNHNDWSEWEKSPARIAQLKKEGKDPADFISGQACDSYHRFREDFDIAKELGHNVHRFSIEWSRIEPEEGRFNQQEIEHYKTLIAALRERGMEPMVTLWHFTNPTWFSAKGGWLHEDAPKYFERYVKVVVDNFKDQVGYWITLNEPTSIYASFAYLKGLWPPHATSVFKFLKATNNLKKAHILAYQTIKKIYADVPPPEGLSRPTSHNVMIGFAENNAYVVIGHGLIKKLAGKIYNYYRNLNFISAAAPYCDFIGLNYYNLDRRPFKNLDVLPKQWYLPAKNWELYPPGIYDRLLDLNRRFEKPIFITENGIANVDDPKRTKFVREHLFWIHKAIKEGVDVRGYLYWSLIDNFEIVDGFPVRFGLVEIDYKTFERNIRPSAREYATICRTNVLEY